MRCQTMQEFQDRLKYEEQNSKDKTVAAKDYRYDPLRLTEWAHTQMAQKMGIPKGYYDRMREETPVLLVENVDTWLKRDDRNLLIRELDGQVRAILSDRYMPLSNRLVCNTVAVSLLEMRVPFEVLRQWLTERSMYFTIISPTEYQLGTPEKPDTVKLGITVRNSEVGYSRFEVQTFMYRNACKNGAIFGRDDVGSFTKVHFGERIKTTGYIDLSDTTKRLDVAATLSAIKDIIRTTFDPASFEGVLARIKAGKQNEVSDKVSAVLNLKDQAKLSDELEKLILTEFQEPTQYGLANAVTAAARQQENEEKQIELEELGGKILVLDAEAFKKSYTVKRV